MKMPVNSIRQVESDRGLPHSKTWRNQDVSDSALASWSAAVPSAVPFSPFTAAH